MNGFRLTIDYGTSSTVAMLRWPDGRTRPLLFDSSPLLPSAVFAAPDGRLLVGRDAERGGRAEPARFEPNPKRRISDGSVLLGEESIPVVTLIAATLRTVAMEAVRVAGALPADVVITYPATWAAVRRSVLTEAAVAASLATPRLVPEPVAAAAYFATALGHRVGPGQVVVVYDLGGGTLDVSAVRRTADGFEVAAVEGLTDFGGVDLDAVLVALLEPAVDPEAWRRLTAPTGIDDQRQARQLWEDARAAKETLSRQPNATVGLSALGRDLQVGQEQFWSAARAPLARAAELTASVLRGFAPGDVAGLFLVGGSTRVPLVSTTLHQATGIAPTVLEQPELAVAEGALYAAAPLAAHPAPPPAVDPSAPTSPAFLAQAGPRPRSRSKVLVLVAGALAVLLLGGGGVYWLNRTRSDPGASGDGGAIKDLPSGGAKNAAAGPSYGYDVDVCAKVDLSLVQGFAGDARTKTPIGPQNYSTFATTGCLVQLQKSGATISVTSLSISANVQQYVANAKLSCDVAKNDTTATDKGPIAGVGTGAFYSYNPDMSAVGASPLPGTSAYRMSRFTICAYTGNLALTILVVTTATASADLKDPVTQLAKQVLGIIPRI